MGISGQANRKLAANDPHGRTSYPTPAAPVEAGNGEGSVLFPVVTHPPACIIRTVQRPDTPCPPATPLVRPPKPSWLKSRIRTALNYIGTFGVTVATGGYARWVATLRIEYPQLGMPLRGLHPAFEGFRLIHLSDLHAVRGTPLKFLGRVIERVNAMQPDYVVVTGDLISHSQRGLKEACELVGRIEAPTAVTFGNHDYAPSWNPASSTELADAMQADLEQRGVTVLRNAAVPIERGGGRIWLAGMEDLWSQRYDSATAFAAVDRDDPIIALSHNPDTVYDLELQGAQWVLAGHTHGGQIRIPLAGPMALPIQHKHLDMGLFRIGQTSLYISRGVGSTQRIRFRCPPEVPCFTLEREG